MSDARWIVHLEDVGPTIRNPMCRTICNCPVMGLFEPGGGEQPDVSFLATFPPILEHCPHCGEEHRCFEVVVPGMGR